MNIREELNPSPLANRAVQLPMQYYTYPYAYPQEGVSLFPLLIKITQVHSHYGSFMHFYVRSMRFEIFQILKVSFKNLNNTVLTFVTNSIACDLQVYKHSRIMSWPRIRLENEAVNDHDFNPNHELEGRYLSRFFKNYQ